jgi:circadian clock protein KaiB
MLEDQPEEVWVLYLYVAGMTPAAKRALSNIKAICEEHAKGRYSLELIDLLERPALAERHQIFAVPTLVRQKVPLRKLIGDMANAEKVMWGLDMQPAAATV